MEKPLVSVICICYNQARFVSEAIDSVINQTYQRLELIIIDDASNDDSQTIISEKIKTLSIPITTIFNTQNIGNCRSFNRGFKVSRGQYIIDLAADDVLNCERIEIGIDAFLAASEDHGVHYGAYETIDHNGQFRQIKKTTLPKSYEGDVYQSLINHYWINPASMMIKRVVLETLNGYDETLTYEDFDFWIRSSRQFLYLYTPQKLVKKREVKGSLGSKQNKFLNKHEYSTYKVCRKIKSLNQNHAEDLQLHKRIKYEIRRNVMRGHILLALRYLGLMIKK
jgi:glycosyltransferase involved in cell wall biosynthesis